MGIAKIFKTHIRKAINELGISYKVTLKGNSMTPLRITVEINSKDEIP